MAVDGSLIFNTKIDDDGFNKGTKAMSSKVVDLKNKISATETEIKKLKSEMEKMSDTKVTPKIAEELEKNIAEAKKQLKSYQKQMSEIRYDTRSSLSRAGIESDTALERTLSKDSNYQQAKRGAQEYQAQLISLERELERVNSAAPLAKDTADYQIKEQKLRELSGQLDVYNAKLREAEQSERSSSTSLASAKRQLDRTLSGLKMLASGAAKAGKALKTAFSKTAGRMISSVASHLRNAHSSTNVLEKSLRRIKNTLVRMFFFRLVHSPIDAVKDGLGEIAKISPEVNKNLSALKTESTYLKNSFASLAAPLVGLITPAMTGFMQVLSGVVSKAAELAALLTGQSYARAVKVQQDYAASLDESTKSANKNTKALEKNQHALAGFDELNVMDNKSDDTESSSSSPLFESATAQADGLGKSLLNAFKKADFNAVGKIIGDKINSALEKINWSKIKEKLKNTAENIADLLNGFIGNVDWSLVGDTIANALGAGLIFALSFLNKFDFSQFGFAIARLINALISPSNMALLAKTLSSFITGIGTTLITLISATNWTKISRSIISFISNFKTADISRAAVNLINGFASALYKIDFKAIGKSFREGINKINWKGIWDGVSRLTSNALQGLVDFFGLKGVSTSKFKTALKALSSPISKLYGTLKDSAEQLLKPLINDFLPAAINMAGSLIKAVSPVISALTPVIKRVIEVITSFEKFAPVIESIGESIGDMIDSLWPIIEPIFTLIENVVKILAPAVEFISDLIGGIFQLLSPINQVLGGIFEFFSGGKEDKPTLSAELQEELDHLSNISDDLTNVQDNISGAIGSVDEAIANTTGDLQYIDDLHERMVQLIEKGTLDNKEMQELNTIADLIAEKYPEFKKTWDNMVNVDTNGQITFKENKDKMISSIDETIKKMKEQYAVEALQEEYKKLYAEKIAANKQVNESLSKVTEAQDEYNSKVLDYDFAEANRQRLEKEWAKGNTTVADELKKAREKAEKAKIAMDEYGGALESHKGELLVAYARQGQLNGKIEEVGNILDVVSGKYDRNNKDLQALRDAYNAGFIDLDSLKEEFNVSADELYAGSLSAGENVIKGYKHGIADGTVEMNNMGIELGHSLLQGTYDTLGIHSPSKKFKEIGSYAIEGLKIGFNDRIADIIQLVRNLGSDMTEALKESLNDFSFAIEIIPDMFRRTFNVVLADFENFLANVTAGFNSQLQQINSINRALGESKHTSYTVWSPMSKIRVPRLATGTVVPANYGEFLAVLGDNKREAEVVSPVSAIEQAVENVLNRRGESSDRPIYVTVVCEDGSVLFETVAKEDDRYTKAHGYSRFGKGYAY